MAAVQDKTYPLTNRSHGRAEALMASSARLPRARWHRLLTREDGYGTDMLAAKMSWSSIQNATGCSRATVAKIAKRIAAA